MLPPFSSFTQLRSAIFFLPMDAFGIFYTPGLLAVVDDRLLPSFRDQLMYPPAAQEGTVHLLQQKANAAQQAYWERLTRPFTPVCLTLYLHNVCNLHCTYCYANSLAKDELRLEMDEIIAAAKLVAANCRQQNRPFTLVCHGGGEPTLYQPYLQDVLTAVGKVVASADLKLFRYVATNGVMSAGKAAWLATQFDLVGLSCDGPEAIQSGQRPLRGGQSSTPALERTARIIHEVGTPLLVRVTVTPDSAPLQSQIAAYLCQVIKPDAIEVEPVYTGGRGIAPATEDAAPFVHAFLKAEQIAAGADISWRFSGSRLHEIHGPYCHLFRDVLNLVPGNAATACFKQSRGEDAASAGVKIGHRSDDGAYHLERKSLARLRQKAMLIPAKCSGCFNQFHCVRDCPDHCVLQDSTEITDTFRCLVQKQLSLARLQRTATQLWADKEAGSGTAVKETNWL